MYFLVNLSITHHWDTWARMWGLAPSCKFIDAPWEGVSPG